MLKPKISLRFSKTYLSVRKCARLNFFHENTLISVKLSIKTRNKAWDFLYNNKPNYANINSEIILEKLRYKAIDFQKHYSW